MLSVTLPFPSTVNWTVSVLSLYPSGADTSFNVYVPSVRFDILWDFAVVVQLVTTLPLLFRTSKTAPASAFPVVASIFNTSNDPVFALIVKAAEALALNTSLNGITIVWYLLFTVCNCMQYILF